MTGMCIETSVPRARVAPQAVAAAALVLAALLNAPPGFLEFIICIPWRSLGELYPRPAAMEDVIGQLDMPPADKRRLVNTPIHPLLMPPVLDFLFTDSYAAGLPPLFQVRRRHVSHGCRSGAAGCAVLLPLC